ncbi:hypothetical protein [Dendronalium sp. ChiSLP03b]|uniref:hypothetical protein n=1 Tax=Dendronalium sp. ChiSLP03b TaxID=3075381 RepID=UPI002AD3EA5B|nr:hypothetical protein [Dendronalium sp. ChiSLP03b]MDZ8209435.1 hypothetical protein [Dendronalium sp. ChiSLP03b]
MPSALRVTLEDSRFAALTTQSGATPILGFHATSYPAGRRSAYNGGNPRNGVAPQVEEIASKTATASPPAFYPLTIAIKQ